MRTSELDKKINFVIKEEMTGAIENLEGKYTPVIENIWAKKTQLLGKESIKLGLEHNTVQVNFIVRTRKDIADDMYIQHGNMIYNIVGYAPLEKDPNFMLIATVRKCEV